MLRSLFSRIINYLTLADYEIRFHRHLVHDRFESEISNNVPEHTTTIIADLPPLSIEAQETIASMNEALNRHFAYTSHQYAESMSARVNGMTLSETMRANADGV